ncbi:F0F1 ATP synthase subunit B family protein [Polymorphobacter sp.]|uniref:F0F1 ATP synthase subunit B family protein n=1 Tax=Polymorphobacter sp. TaxID=1909290 RepID=UPI003F727AAB
MADQLNPPAMAMPGAFGEPVEGSELLGVPHDGAHAEETLLGLGAETWVYVSVAIFFALAIILGKLPQRIAEALDGRIAGVRRQLDEASALRAEAETLLADAKARAEAATRDAEAIVARAQVEAASLMADSEKAAAETIARRTAAAEAKIVAAERGAEVELRGELARQVTAAAAALIAAKADPAMHDRLTEAAIAGLDRRLH